MLNVSDLSSLGASLLSPILRSSDTESIWSVHHHHCLQHHNITIIVFIEATTTMDIIITLLIISESIKSGGEGDSPASKRRRLSVSGHEVNILLRHQMIKTTIKGINVMVIMMTRRFLNSWSNAPLLYLDLRLVLVKQLVLDNLQDLDNRLPTIFLTIRLADVIMQPIRQVLPWWSQ